MRRNPFPYFVAFLIPVVASGLVTLFLKGFTRAGCSGDDAFTASTSQFLTSFEELEFVLGPSSRGPPTSLDRFVTSLLAGPSNSTEQAVTELKRHFHVVDSFQDFRSCIERNFANVTPGGIYLGDSSFPPTFAWEGDSGGLSFSATTQNALDTFLTNVSIGFQFQSFDIPWQPNAGKTHQLVTYFVFAMGVYPAFFALYPTAVAECSSTPLQQRGEKFTAVAGIS